MTGPIASEVRNGTMSCTQVQMRLHASCASRYKNPHIHVSLAYRYYCAVRSRSKKGLFLKDRPVALGTARP